MVAQTKEKKQRGWTKWVVRSVGFLILVLLVMQVNQGGLLNEFAAANPLLLALAFLMNAVHFLIKGTRWHTILVQNDVSCTRRQCVPYYCTGALVGLVTPGRIGELCKVVFAREWDQKAPWGTAMGTVVADRVVDVMAFGMVALWGAVSVGLPGNYRLLTEVIVVLLLAMGVYLAIVVWRNLVGSAHAHRLREAVEKKVGRWPVDLLKVFHHLLSPRGLMVLLWTVIAYALFFGHFILLGKALGSELPNGILCWGIALASLGAILPISVSGIGVRDFILLAIFTSWGETPEKTLAISLTYLGLLYLAVALLGAGPFIKGEFTFKSLLRTTRRAKQEHD